MPRLPADGNLDGDILQRGPLARLVRKLAYSAVGEYTVFLTLFVG